MLLLFQIFWAVCFGVCLANLYPFWLAEQLIRFSHGLVNLYNSFKAWCRQQAIHREGTVQWKQTVKDAAKIAASNHMKKAELLRDLFEHKDELIDEWGTRYLKQVSPWFFEDLEIDDRDFWE